MGVMVVEVIARRDVVVYMIAWLGVVCETQ